MAKAIMIPAGLELPDKIECGQFVRADTLRLGPVNASGVQPLDLRVVVKPDKVEEITKGGIILPDQTKEADRFACQKGTLVAVGENAWEEASARSPNFRRPEAGDRVMIGKYAGSRFKGVDGEDYVLMNDEDVIGRLEE